ncbi:MAG: class 1 fructose-bisphosphatase [Hyphomicrobiales bacterium]|nr:class 1 fructose-bisphosphatase [Hyphomicrobiales bacterium]
MLSQRRSSSRQFSERESGVILNAYLNQWAAGEPLRTAIAATIGVLAEAATSLADMVGRGPLADEMHDLIAHHADGDAQRRLDIMAEDMIADRLRHAPVRYLASEESESALDMIPGAPLAVALDPLDGSTNIDANAPLGMIFSLLPALDSAGATFKQVGRRQLAAGFFIFGPHTSLAITLGDGVMVFTLDRTTQRFTLARQKVTMPKSSREYAVNASNARFWSEGVRSFVEELTAGADGPRAIDFNTRWIGALCGEAYRILLRGGLYLYPGGTRRGQVRGRLRLLYEANPIAMLIEQAGGGATDGERNILDIAPDSLHVHTPLVFGSFEEVARFQKHVSATPIAGYMAVSVTQREVRM